MGNLFSKKEDESSKETEHHTASYREEGSDVDNTLWMIINYRPNLPSKLDLLSKLSVS